MVNQALCFGDTTTVSVSVTGGTGSINYFWIGFNPQDANPGVFSPYVDDENGCQASQTIEVFEVLELVTTLQSTPADDGDIGTIDLTILGGTGDYSISWSGPDGFTSSQTNLTELAPGFYTVIVQDDNGCISSSSILVSDTFIGEAARFEGKIYPIPSDGILNIESVQQIDALKLVDLSGRKQREILVQPGNLFTSFNVEGIAPGVYLLLIEQQGLVLTERIILN